MARSLKIALLNLVYLLLLFELLRMISATLRLGRELPDAWPFWVVLPIALGLFGIVGSLKRSLLRNRGASPQACSAALGRGRVPITHQS